MHVAMMTRFWFQCGLLKMSWQPAKLIGHVLISNYDEMKNVYNDNRVLLKIR